VTVNDVSDGHVLGYQCLEPDLPQRYIPTLQTSARSWRSSHITWLPVPLAGLFNQIGSVPPGGDLFAQPTHSVGEVRQGQVGGKLDLMWRPHCPPGRHRQSGVAAIGVAQEFQRVWTAYDATGLRYPQWSFTKATGG